MKKSRMHWTVKRLGREIKAGAVSFDYPIQRAGEQWDNLQKSLFIHSLACDYPVPPLYALTQEETLEEGDKVKQVSILYVLDGKQRSTNVNDFIDGLYRLDVNTPVFKVNGEEYDVAGYSFEELPEIIQDAINEFTLDIFKIEEATDEEIEDMFYRLNNGTPLTQVQKAKAKMGNETALQFQRVTNHKVLKNNAVFTPLQIKQANDEVALFQSMMLLDKDYKVGKFGNSEVFDYASSLRRGRGSVFEVLEKTLDYLSETLQDSVEKVLLKKLHFPMVVYASNYAMNNNIPTSLFAKFLEGFKAKITDKSNNVIVNGIVNEGAWLYKLGCGAGATKAEKVAERLHATKLEIEAFIATVDESEREVFVPRAVKTNELEASEPEATKKRTKKVSTKTQDTEESKEQAKQKQVAE